MRVLFVVFFLSCLIFQPASLAESETKDSSTEITVGVIAGLTGDYASVFQNWVSGITLAHELHQKSGKSPKVKLHFEDDQFNASKGLSAYRKLIEVNDITALLNGSSATIGAISPLVKRKGIPVIQLGEETEEPADDNILQIMPGNIETEKALGNYLSEKFSTGIALFYTLHPTMVRFSKAFKEGYGQPLSGEFEMDPAMKDLRPLIIKALSQKPKCVAVLAFPPQGALLVKGLRELSKEEITLAFDGSFQTGYADYERLLGNLDFLKKNYVVVLESDTAGWFRDKYRKRFGEDPGTMADLGFDAFNLLLSGYDLNSRDWISKLKKIKFTGASGEVVFDQEGIRRPKFSIMTIGQYRRRR
jgi:ABC-type branched-subunit amino acid transport system substrate-binding protein